MRAIFTDRQHGICNSYSSNNYNLFNMQKTVFKIFLFTLILISVIILNMIAFRSDLPKLWFITLIGSVIVLIFFPYNKFFNNNKNK